MQARKRKLHRRPVGNLKTKGAPSAFSSIAGVRNKATVTKSTKAHTKLPTRRITYLELQLKRDPKPLVTTANRRHDRLSPDLAAVAAVRGARDHQQSDDGIRLHPCK